jgi:magnesium transporter
MVRTHTYKNVTWIDLECPTQEEVRSLMKTYNIQPLAAEELLLPTTRTKVDVYDDSIYLILHFPAWKHAHQNVSQEVDFIIGKDYIVTARYESIDPLDKFAKMIEVNSVLERNVDIGKHAGYMFYFMLREIYHSLHDELESARDNFEDIQKKVFTGHEKETVFDISNLSRELLAFKHATAFHGEMLASFATAATRFFGEAYSHYTEALKSEYVRITKTIQSLSESLYEVRETNAALLDTKQNRIVMTLTSVTFISSILGILVAMFETKAESMPIVGMPHDFWIIALILVAAGLGMTALFFHKKWL